MIRHGELEPLHEQKWQSDEACRQYRVQEKYVNIDAQQLRPERATEVPLPRCRRSLDIVGQCQQQGRCNDRQRGAEQKQRRHAIPGGKQRPENHCHHECAADADSEHGHGARTHAVASRIRDQCGQSRRNRTGALQQTAGDDAVYRVAVGGENAAQRKDRKPADDHRNPADPIRKRPEGYLQAGLRQAIGAHGKPDKDRRRAFEACRIQRQYRQQRKQAEHAQHADERNDTHRTPFSGKHRLNGAAVCRCHQ